MPNKRSMKHFELVIITKQARNTRDLSLGFDMLFNSSDFTEH